MRHTVRRAVAFAATTAVAGLSFMVTGPSAAAAAPPAACPAGKYCLYDNPDYTNPLVVSSERWVAWIGAPKNDRVSSVINNSGETLHLFKNVDMDGPNGSILNGGRISFTGQFDNQISSYYLY
jgi:hypothetical protein